MEIRLERTTRFSRMGVMSEDTRSLIMLSNHPSPSLSLSLILAAYNGRRCAGIAPADQVSKSEPLHGFTSG